MRKEQKAMWQGLVRGWLECNALLFLFQKKNISQVFSRDWRQASSSVWTEVHFTIASSTV